MNKIEKAQDIANELGLIFTGEIINSRIDYFQFEHQSFLGWIYQPDIDYIYDLVFALNTCSKYSIERRQNNLANEFRKAGIFLAGEITIKLKETVLN